MNSMYLGIFFLGTAVSIHATSQPAPSYTEQIIAPCKDFINSHPYSMRLLKFSFSLGLVSYGFWGYISYKTYCLVSSSLSWINFNDAPLDQEILLDYREHLYFQKLHHRMIYTTGYQNVSSQTYRLCLEHIDEELSLVRLYLRLHALFPFNAYSEKLPATELSEKYNALLQVKKQIVDEYTMYRKQRRASLPKN